MTEIRRSDGDVMTKGVVQAGCALEPAYACVCLAAAIAGGFICGRRYIPVWILLVFNSYTDVRTRTIPVWLFPSVALIGSSVLLYIGLFGYWNIIGLACMFVPMFILAITGNFGGGDILMFAAVGLILGEDVAGYVFILASISTVFILSWPRRIPSPLSFSVGGGMNPFQDNLFL